MRTTRGAHAPRSRPSMRGARGLKVSLATALAAVAVSMTRRSRRITKEDQEPSAWA
jgi:hypothetical protein